MQTDISRAIHARKGLALPSDLTDAEWSVLEPFLPLAFPGGRPRKWPTRRLVEVMLYVLRGGLPWRMLSPGFPPMTTAQRYFYAWRDSGVWQDDQPLPADGPARDGGARGLAQRRGNR